MQSMTGRRNSSEQLVPLVAMSGSVASVEFVPAVQLLKIQQPLSGGARVGWLITLTNVKYTHV